MRTLVIPLALCAGAACRATAPAPAPTKVAPGRAAAPNSAAAPHAARGSGTLDFDGAPELLAQAGWQALCTQPGGAASWSPRADAAAPSPPNVLALRSAPPQPEGAYQLYFTLQPRIADGWLSVRLRADGGALDQGGGLVWRMQGPGEYYLCRFNPLERNLRLYVVRDGLRVQLASAEGLERPPGSWVKLDVAFEGNHITAALDGMRRLDVYNDLLRAGGGLGLWAKSDAQTSFDELVIADARDAQP